MNDMRDRIEQNEEMPRAVVPQTQRQERHVLVALNHEELENKLKNNGEYPKEEEALVTRHVLNAQVKEDDIEQQHGNIFHTRYHVNNKVCNLIIDGEGCANVASALLVEKLQLPTHKHLKPYKL